MEPSACSWRSCTPQPARMESTWVHACESPNAFSAPKLHAIPFFVAPARLPPYDLAGFTAGWIMKMLKAWVGVVLFVVAPLAQATVFTVTSTADTDGAACGPTCTLRQAINAASAAGGTNTIEFALTGQGPYTIALASQLPAINTPGTAHNLTIDGFSQLGSVKNTNAPDQGGINATLMVEIVGASGTYGFWFAGGAAATTLTIKGLCLHGFYIPISGNPDSTVFNLNLYGSFIGTKIDGSALPAQGNSDAIRLSKGISHIGGALPEQRNVLSGNATGVLLATGGTVVIEGNLIGTDAGGTVAIPNGLNSGWPGIYMQGDLANVRIGCTGVGCTNANSRNVISGNRSFGIGIWDTYAANSGLAEIKGNYIGTDWTGTKPLPNGDATAGCPTYCGGIQLQGGMAAKPASIIGGLLSAGEANLIAFNKGAGIVSGSNQPGESFDSQGNAVHDNAGFGSTNIEVGALGPTANDAGDPDGGVNNGQNYPVVTAVNVVGQSMNVTYHVDSATSNASYPLRVDFYRDIHGGTGELLFSDSYDAGHAQANKIVAIPVPVSGQPVAFVATATDANHYTSEISPDFDVIFRNGVEK